MYIVWWGFFVSRCSSSNCTGMIRDEKGTNRSTLWSQKFGTVKITFHSERWSLVTFVCYWCDSPQWARASSFTRFLDHTQRRTTVGGLLWTSDHIVAETSTWQHTTLTTDKRPWPRWDSNPQPQQASGRRPTPWTARPAGPASFVNLRNLMQHKCLHITNARKFSTTSLQSSYLRITDCMSFGLGAVVLY